RRDSPRRRAPACLGPTGASACSAASRSPAVPTRSGCTPRTPATRWWSTPVTATRPRTRRPARAAYGGCACTRRRSASRTTAATSCTSRRRFRTSSSAAWTRWTPKAQRDEETSQPDHGQADERCRVAAYDLFQQHDARALDPEAAGTAVRLVVPQVSLGEGAVEGAEAPRGPGAVLVMRTGGVEHARGGEETDLAPGDLHELRHRPCGAARLAGHAGSQHRDRVGADHDRPGAVAADRLGLLAGEPAGERR